MRKLTETEYFELHAQFDRTPHPDEGFMASGEHYMLVALLNRFGFYPHGRREAYELAEELLIQGYEKV